MKFNKFRTIVTFFIAESEEKVCVLNLFDYKLSAPPNNNLWHNQKVWL